MSTGYFSHGGKRGRTMVHYVLHGKPICGTRLPHRAEYQVCNSGFCADLIECRRCKRALRRVVPEAGR